MNGSQCRSIQRLLKKERVNVDSKNPKTGTSALIQGSICTTKERYATTTRYVSPMILIRRVQLVSQALSASTLRFLASSAAIRFSRSSVAISKQYHRNSLKGANA